MTHVVIECSQCGQKNRLPALRLDESPQCGHCHQTLTSAAPIEVDQENLLGLIRESPLPLLVDFWAPWCGPCHKVAPQVARVAKDNAGRLLCLKVNVDEAQQASAQHHISGIPALILFHGGKERNRLVGAHPASAIQNMVQATEASKQPAYGVN